MSMRTDSHKARPLHFLARLHTMEKIVLAALVLVGSAGLVLIGTGYS
ncbi:hypothetical protein IFT84_10560 [Rhizobium sp. CFBP 8762]|nr:hypothetical protein [Rhizobium sp. CFBP 8762]MBD8554965.1 hypothetical protein [Rhizobium sp. CFBP 8762]